MDIKKACKKSNYKKDKERTKKEPKKHQYKTKKWKETKINEQIEKPRGKEVKVRRLLP